MSLAMKRRKARTYTWAKMTDTEKRNQRIFEFLNEGYTLDYAATTFKVSREVCREAFVGHLERLHRDRAQSYNLRDDWDKMVYMKTNRIECDAAIVEYETRRSYTDGEKGLW